jgi:hypothetical protein
VLKETYCLRHQGRRINVYRKFSNNQRENYRADSARKLDGIIQVTRSFKMENTKFW